MKRLLITLILYFFIFNLFSQINLIPKKINNQWCFIDSVTGKILIQTEFDYIVEFHCYIARVKKNDKWGYIDTTGKLITPICFDWAEDFKDGYAVITFIKKRCKNSPTSYLMQKIKCRQKYGFVDIYGNVRITKYDYLTSFTDGYAKVFKTPWWKLRWNYNIDWKKIDTNMIEYDIPE